MNSEERKREEVKEILREKLDSYVGEDFDILRNMVYTCNSYDSGLEDYYYWNNDEEFYEIMFPDKDEVARAVYYASNYCYTDEYIRLNVYGNCETISEYEYEQLLIENKEEIIEEYIEGLFEDFDYFMQDICDNELRKEIEELGKIEVE